ncbi:hypothetical protein ABEB36_011316 [Hypothenemus hampei]|uniref:C2H2-type domain-containing protein n=1 Tax=Hypothenemus hampei TaxID=57062 RepID=A0ABD1EF02_HYPHA
MSLNVGHIEKMKLLDARREQFAFSFQELQNKFNEFIIALKIIYPQDDWECYDIIMDEVLKDIKEIGIVERIYGEKQIIFADNSSAIFNIGKRQYCCAKTNKLKPTDDCITCTEIIIPEIELTFIYMDYEGMDKYIESIRNFTLESNLNPESFSLPSLIYSCNFCRKDFIMYQDVIIHLIQNHSINNDVLCMKCNKPFNTIELIKDRWTHNCPEVDNVK